MASIVGRKVLLLLVLVSLFEAVISIYNPNEIDQTKRPYSAGIKIKVQTPEYSYYQTLAEPYYHSNYSKVYVHNKNYTSSLLDSASSGSKVISNAQTTKLYPVYMSDEKKEKIKNVLKEHNTNVVEKDTLNNRVVYKRRIEKSKNIEVYNKCPKGVSGQFVYDLSCNQYLDCWNGRGGPRNCAPGTLFNPKSLECDFPEKVECLTGPLGGSLTVQKTANYQNYEQAKCPEGFSGLIPNYTDCTKFIQCNSGIQTKGTCPPGTLFDTSLNVCNHPRETTCFSGESGAIYAIKEGHNNQNGQYQSQGGQYASQNGQYHHQGGQHHYGGGQYSSQDGQFSVQGGQYSDQSGQSYGQSGQYSGHGGQYSGPGGQSYGQSGQYSGQGGQYSGQGGHYSGPSGQSYGQSGQYSGQGGQYSGQGGRSNSNSGQTFYGTAQRKDEIISGQNHYLGQGYSHGTINGQQYGSSQNVGSIPCDPSSSSCINQGQDVYRNPQVSQGGGTVFVAGGSNSNFGQGFQYPGGCDQLSPNCQQGTGTTYSQSSFTPSVSSGGQPQNGDIVYIQYVMCNTVLDDCTNFQQGTFMLGPGGTLCNPVKQSCRGEPYIPNIKMHEQGSKVPQSGIYYVKYIMCNPIQEDCTKYQRGIVEATYGVPGTLIGAKPVEDTQKCDPQLYNCDTVQYQGQTKPQVSTYDQISGSPGGSGQSCNPQYQNCAKSPHGDDEKKYGNPSSSYGTYGRFPKKFNSTTTNYKKICSDGDSDCYQGIPSNQNKLGGVQKPSSGEPECPDGYQGVMKHPTSCKKFLNCGNGQTHVQECGSGTLFNPFIKACDFPYNVDCKQEPSETHTTLEYSDLDSDIYQSQQGPYGKTQGSTPLPEGHTSCQGLQCTQGQGYVLHGQYSSGQSSNGQNQQGHIGGTYEEIGCQGSQCVQGQNQYPGQLGQGYQNSRCQGYQCVYQQPSQVQTPPTEGSVYNQGQLGFAQSDCSGLNCFNRPQGQAAQGQHPGQMGINYGNTQGQAGCQGAQCIQQPQGGFSVYQGNNCQGNQCRTNQGYTTPSSQTPGTYGSFQGQPNCQGQQCSLNQGNVFQGQIEDNDDQVDPYKTTTQRTYLPPTQGNARPGQDYQPNGHSQSSQGGRGDQGSHVMKIPSNKGYQSATPINKFDRVTHGGFNNQKSIDYVDIFDPDESRNYAYATTTRKTPKKQVWPPPYPDLATTDSNADYVFEYEDGEPVTLAPEKVNTEKRKKTRCGDNDFVCDKKSCVAKNFVCDGVRDCDDGKDEKYCQKYMDQFKPYKNSRLDVLEKQRWDNVSYSTCALLCMDSQKFECKSFNYRKLDRACFLTNENIGTSGALKNYYPCDYYERKCTSLDCSDMHKCPNGKCLTSDQVCDGYDDCGDRADEKGCRASDFGYKIRLAGALDQNEGRVEVTVFGKTGYICDDQFDLNDANVLCKELGFHLGAAEVKGNSYFAKDLKENHTLYMMDDIECLGNETSIMHCNFAGWGIHNCADKEIAGVVCKTPQETCAEGFWKCDTGNECVKIPFLCDDLDDCTDNSDEASHHCDSPTELRLVNGTRENEGRLEIRHNGIWGSICDDDFNEDAAKIVCRHLGFTGSAYVKKDAYFGQSTGPIWLDQVSCFGNETSLEKCAHWAWGEHNCDHSEDVGIVCSNEIMEVDAQRSSKSIAGDVKNSIKDLKTSNSSPEPVSCGFRKDNIFLQNDDVHFRVVQGSLAKPGDYPWQAALRIKGQEKSAHWCGAVVISSKWVLTAAHCLEGYTKGAYVVVAGEYDMDEDEGIEQQAFIEEYYIHEHFKEGHKMGNDIAMIKLKGNGFKLNQDIQPICLPDEDSDYERELNCTISGFGTIQTGKSAASHKLRAAWIPVQKMDVCKMAHIYGDAIAEGMICAGDLNGGVDACDGDSGGPLACLENGVFTLYGITSWGQRCGYANKPGVYVKVSYYRKWIEDVMKLHS